MARKEEEAPAGAPEWMCTFSDMMSLLLCFFVLLFSMSTIEKKKMVQASGSLRKAFGGLPAPYMVENIPDKKTAEEISRPSQMERRKSYAKSELLREEQHKFKTMNLQSVVEVTGTEQGITFRMSGDAIFQSGSFELTAKGIDALIFITDELLQFPDNPIKVDGHTDSSNRRGDLNQNWWLGAERAYTVMKFLTEIGSTRGRISKNRISYESFGQFKPLPGMEENRTEIQRAMNRRVEITLLQTDEGGGTFFSNEEERNPRTPLIVPDSETKSPQTGEY